METKEGKEAERWIWEEIAGVILVLAALVEKHRLEAFLVSLPLSSLAVVAVCEALLLRPRWCFGRRRRKEKQ